MFCYRSTRRRSLTSSKMVLHISINRSTGGGSAVRGFAGSGLTVSGREYPSLEQKVCSIPTYEHIFLFR